MNETIRLWINDVVGEATNRFYTFRGLVDYDSLSTKLKSELISNILEASFAKVVPQCISPRLDSEPDLVVGGIPLEIKTSKTTHIWRGGEYSKRASDYLLVSYDDSGGGIKWFFMWTSLLKGDWKSSSSGSYYATTIDLDWVMDNKDYDIIVGGVVKKKVKRHLVCK